jgi:hypothetical protein
MKKLANTLAYYITAHGYGHGARSCDILAALLRLRPDLVVHVVTDLPRVFMESRLPRGNLHYRAGCFDVGMVQFDSIRVDVSASLRAARDLLAAWPARVRQEMDFLRAAGVGAVVADIPGIPLQAARRSGLPALAVGNFSWDWIYEPFAAGDAGWLPVMEAYRAAYAECDLLLRLPFHEPMQSFPCQRDLPLLARPGRNQRAAIAQRTGADPGSTWALLSFTTLAWNDEALARVAAVPDTTFFTVKPLAWDRPGLVALDRREFPYADVLASCDVVITKPGFGVLSECAVNNKPIIYAERQDFREYAVLETALRRYLRHVHLPARQLYRGELTAALIALRTAPPAQAHLASGGDDEAAAEILARL